MAARRDEHLLAAAIDFGTTYSGYAYSFKDDFKKDPLRMYTNEQWIDEDTNLVTFKTPTTILFGKDGKFKSFGFKAESVYNTLVDEEKDKGWRYFRRFKMKLYQEVTETELGSPRKRLARNLQLKDAHGETMSAMTIFSEAIKFLKDHLLTTVCNSIKGLTNDDILWILTVPAIWSESAKQFMREAATKAGIKNDQLTLALEPEAAAIYCKEIAVSTSKEDGHSKGLSTFTPGEQFLLLDIGGGTVDITCHEVLNDGLLKEVHPPSGGPWGGTVVDHAYFDFLRDLVGKDTWSHFTNNNPSDKLEIERTFELKKRNLKDDATFIRVGNHLLDSYTSIHRCTLSKTLSESKSKYNDVVQVIKEKLKINNSQMNALFQGPITAIVEHLERLFMKRTLSHVSTILMVGGFSESDLMKAKIEESFPTKAVIRPADANLAVLKGAVLFGHSPQAICERASPRTFGISVSVPFNEAMHPRKSYWKSSDGQDKCTDVFQIMVKLGQPVIMGKTTAKHTCAPASATDTQATVEVYESTSQRPQFTYDPSCRLLGELRVCIPDTTKGKGRRIVVELHFGFTELKVTATEEGYTNHRAETTFDCLSTKI